MRCVSPLSIKDPRQSRGSIRITVPCGKCGACKHNRRIDWSYRLAKEAKEAMNASFLTLTYNDENLPRNQFGLPSLRKRDLQLFTKRIRKLNSKVWDKQLRYYSVGEYGTQTQRPHYHSVMFNLHPSVWPKLADTWTHGNTRRDQVNDARIHYVTKYHMNYDKDHSAQLSREAEFATMSRRPGIGATHVQDIEEVARSNDQLYVINNGFKQRMPRYYRDKIWTPEEREALQYRVEGNIEDDYWKEYRRLEKLGYEDPDEEMNRRAFEESLRVLKKSKEGLTL